MRDPSDSAPAAKNRVARALLIVVGVVSTVLATVGAFLPVLPTTPFLILAAACFARSSPRFHAKLLENRIFGRYIAQWEKSHTVPKDAKRKAIGLVVVSFALSIALVDGDTPRIVLGLLGLSLICFLASLRTG